MRRAVTLACCFVLFAMQPTLGGAAVVDYTFSAASISFTPAVADFFDYTASSTVGWSDATEFEAGTYSATNSDDTPDSIVLNRIGPTDVIAPDPAIEWWDTDWANRRCFALDHTAPDASSVAEYQLRLTFPIEDLVTEGFLQGDLGDLRAVGADGLTSLPLWPDDTTPDTIWVQVDSIAAAATTDLCLYYAYQPGGAVSPDNHSEAAVFSYATPQEIYYAVSELYSDPGAAINVVSYTDNNTVTRSDGTELSLATAGDLGSFDALGNAPGSGFSVLGPIAAAAAGDGGDALVPISAAGTVFLSPITRDLQHFSFLAPFADANVDLYDGTTLVNSFTVTAGSTYTHTIDDITPGNAAIIDSDVPVLVTHQSDLSGDSTFLYPAADGDYYPVRSSDVLIGYSVDATGVAVADSGGATTAAAGDRGGAATIGGGLAAGGGTSDGVILTADQPIGVIVQEDGDGNESVSVPPSSELGATYWLATDSQYVAFSCPTEESATVAITISPEGGPTRPVSCAGGPEVGWAADTADLTVSTTGTLVSSDSGSPFWAYYEGLATDDQIGILGMKQARQSTWPAPMVTPGSDEGIYEASGTWESETFDSGVGSGIFGTVALAGSTPTGTELRLQLATAASGTPTDFVGPDGTPATHFTLASLPAVADFSHDGDPLLRVRAELVTSDPAAETPQLDQVTIDHHLQRLDRSLGTAPELAVTTAVDPTTTSTFLLRVKTADPDVSGSLSTAVYRGASNRDNLSNETVRFVNESLGIDNVQHSTTVTVEAPILFEAGRPHSVVLDHAAVEPGVSEILFAWQLDYSGAGSIFFETDFMVEVTAP